MIDESNAIYQEWDNFDEGREDRLQKARELSSQMHSTSLSMVGVLAVSIIHIGDAFNP